MPTPLRIAITPGEPAGIGPDLLIQRVQQPHSHDWIAIADAGLLESRARQLGLPLQLIPFDEAQATPLKAGQVYIDVVPLREPAVAGRLDKTNSPYVLACLQRAVERCQAGTFDALVTGPIHKGVINDAGYHFSGHTEFLAEKTHCKQVVMMLATDTLRVALATTHLPLKSVADAITAPRLTRTLRILHASLQQQFNIADPTILVCGLNPHAGEDGHLGREEIDIIQPVIGQLQQQGMRLIGPLPADTLFTPARLQHADAVLAMYHDQGLPVLKYSGFGEAVNITLGLPIIRTSVDHGTALELAGKGQCHTSSFDAAIRMAGKLGTRDLRQHA